MPVSDIWYIFHYNTLFIFTTSLFIVYLLHCISVIMYDVMHNVDLSISYFAFHVKDFDHFIRRQNHVAGDN